MREGARGTRPWPLLIAGLAVAVAVALFLLATVGGPDQETPSGLPASTDSSDGSDSFGVATSPTAGLSTGVVSADFALGDDPVGDGVELACSRFRDGDTVLDFATWFEAEVKLGPAEQQELFQSIIAQALGETCPEVVPGN